MNAAHHVSDSDPDDDRDTKHKKKCAKFHERSRKHFGEKENMKKYIHPYAPLILLLTGLLFLGMGTLRMIRVNRYSATEAVITKIDSYYNGEDYTNDVYVRYTVNGKIYESQIDHYKDSFQEGQTIGIRYDPKDPEKVLYSGQFPSYAATGFGILALALSAYTWRELRR